MRACGVQQFDLNACRLHGRKLIAKFPNGLRRAENLQRPRTPQFQSKARTPFLEKLDTLEAEAGEQGCAATLSAPLISTTTAS
jgi:hypothetical protein